MAAPIWMAALVIGPLVAGASGTSAPFYTADSIANSAASVANFYAPNTFITIYGQNLAFVTKAITPGDINGGILPTALIGTGVRVLVNQIAADIYYVSPTQVNLLVPTILVGGAATVQLEVNGVAGPAVSIVLGATAPSLFQVDALTVLATHADGSLVTAGSPAHGGEEIVLWATGLGPTSPPAIPNQVPEIPALLTAFSQFQVLLNGTPVDHNRIAYAGVTPGYAGLFQINLILPPDVTDTPEVRIATGDATSPSQRYLAVR